MKLKFTLQNFLLSVFMAVGFLITGCSKSTEGKDLQLARQMLSNKIWYLDYSITGNVTKNYVGQSTYFISFLKNNSCTDSDGYVGNYTIEKHNQEIAIHVISQKPNGTSLDYKYAVESVGDNNLILTFTAIGQTQITKMYFSNARL